VAGGAATLARLLRRRTLVLAYHNVVPAGESAGGDRSLHIAQVRFGAHLDALAETHDVVPLGEVLSAPGGRPRAAITFDDGYAGALSAGVAELARRGLPATFFIVPGFLEARTFWWDELADPRSGEVPAPVRAHALEALAGRHEAVLSWAAAEGLPRRTPAPAERTVTAAQLAAAARVPGVTLACHTWSHPNLARLGPGERERELGEARDWLSARFPGALPWLSYPYGRWNAAARDAVVRAGFAAALRVEGGALPRVPRDPFALPRLNVPAGLSPEGFLLRISGL